VCTNAPFSKFPRSGQVGLDHLAESRRGRAGRHLQGPNELGHGHVARAVRELDVHKLLRVERAMPVPTLRDGAREDNACRVHGLEEPFAVDTTGDLSNQHWGETMASKLFVNTQEIDLNERLVGFDDAKCCRYGRDEASQLAAPPTLPHTRKPHLCFISTARHARWVRMVVAVVVVVVARGGSASAQDYMRMRSCAE
jgi:hypothetical protein